MSAVKTLVVEVFFNGGNDIIKPNIFAIVVPDYVYDFILVQIIIFVFIKEAKCAIFA